MFVLADIIYIVTLRRTVQHHLFLYKSFQRNSKSWRFITLQVQATYTTNPFGVQLIQANYTKSHMHVCSECLIQIFLYGAIMASYIQFTYRTVNNNTTHKMSLVSLDQLCLYNK